MEPRGGVESAHERNSGLPKATAWLNLARMAENPSFWRMSHEDRARTAYCRCNCRPARLRGGKPCLELRFFEPKHPRDLRRRAFRRGHWKAELRCTWPAVGFLSPTATAASAATNRTSSMAIPAA